MNITELARILHINPNELRNILPQFGFDIGQKAIKINKNVAQKIINDWSKIRNKLEKQKEAEELKIKQAKIKITNQTIKIKSLITIRDFSTISGLPINIILSELMKNSIFASINERIDFDTAWLIGSSFGISVERQEEDDDLVEEEKNKSNELKEIISREDKKNLTKRAPVIVIMGHVDHGKTKLLDAIRKTNVVDKESGGITQHIGAYQINRKNKTITFIDTPGHEAFTAMRSRGAKIADIAILVVAGDDGVKQQTIEAFNIIQSAKIPFVVAINKMDKEDANLDRTKQELSSKLNIVPEDWGGKTICLPISAKSGKGITDLLDMVLLTSETESENLIANINSPAVGTVIESNINKEIGPVATILVQNGTLKIGDQLILNNTIIGKVRNLKNYKDEKIKTALPSCPAQIIGLKIAPQVGDIIKVGDAQERAKKIKRQGASQDKFNSVAQAEDDENIKKINLIIKSDVFGSAEAIEESLEKINTKHIKTKIIYKGLGNITQGDIQRAESSNAKIIGFNVKTPHNLLENARNKNINIKNYSIIYDLINDIKIDIQALVEAEIERTDLGRVKIKAVFLRTKEKQIIGGQILDGSIEANSLVEVMRNKELIFKGKLITLKSGKQEVDYIEAGQDCGLEFRGDDLVEEGDILIIYKEKEVFEKI